MASLSAQVFQTIEQRGLLSRGDAVLAAVSGGSDSLGLMHVLAELAPRLSLRLRVASVDHGLRPESAHEVRLVGQAAAALGLQFTPLKLDLPAGANLQARGRAARYEALHIEASKDQAKIALGHTLDDQSETVMGRVLRGAGLRGLAGIQPQRRDGVVRPLIDVRRRDIRSYLTERQAEWVEDPSNSEDRFERVRIRRALVLLGNEDAQLQSHLADLADDARAASEALQSMASGLGSRLKALQDAPSAVRRIAIRRLAEDHLGRGIRRPHLEQLERCVLTGKGEVLLGEGWRAQATRGVLTFELGTWEGRSG